MTSLADRITRASSLLAPYAVPHQGMLGRVLIEPDDETRFPFQRDRDRIIHTQAFRRLQGKTQVFVRGRSQGSDGFEADDHVRTRLTHTMEVAQVSRDIARTLGLNEDLAESIALAHDLGHPPFGHAGEEALHQWMQRHGGRFEHNEQSLKLVMVLEEHTSLTRGLNLNLEILDGLRKHLGPHDAPLIPDDIPRAHTLEAQVVNLADEIAYTAHDCDDGLTVKLFSHADIAGVPLAKEALERAQKRGTSLRGSLIHLLVTDLYRTTEETIARNGIVTIEAVQASAHPIVTFSITMLQELSRLRSFLWEHLYLHPQVRARNEEGQRTLLTLCDTFEREPPTKVIALQKKTGSSLSEAIKDYVAGMTDMYAEKQVIS